MEAGEENRGNVNMKRQRTPLSDSEDNVVLQSEVSDGQKRRRLDVAGQENRSPLVPSCSGWGEDQGRKPDTPMIPTVRSRVQQLTQRREGAAPALRCLSDPGTGSPSAADGDKGPKDHLLGEAEFSQRMERFKLPVHQSDSTPSPANACPRTRSNLVSGIHQKLQDTTPSSKQASRIRQEREQEMNQLPFKPISENAWLKRSTSDPSLSEQVDGGADMTDGSFTEAPTTNAEKQTTGGNVPAASGEKQPPAENETAPKTRRGEEEEEPETRTVLTLSFSENPRLSKSPSSEDQNEDVAGDEPKQEVSDKREKSPETFSLDEDEKMDDSLFTEEEIEPSTDEESRMWKYPGYKGEGIGVEQEMEEVGSPEKHEVVEEENMAAEANVDVQRGEDHREPELPPTEETDQEVIDKRQEATENSKKVTFILEPELISGSSLSETGVAMETSMSDGELSSHDETNTADVIDQMFEEVLEYAERIEEEERDGNDDVNDDVADHDSGVGARSGDEGGEEAKEDCENNDELLTFPPSGILSPLSKSVEAVVTPLRLAAVQESNPPSLLLTPEENVAPTVESAPLYSIDAYRTQRQAKAPSVQSVTPGVQRRVAEKSRPRPQNADAKERIGALNEEAAKLQTVISQTLQALSHCIDEEHGRGSLEEAEAEKLLLVSCEKRSALLAEVARLREERNQEVNGGDGSSSDEDYITQQPCRGTVSITNIQLPLKVEFVCSSHGRAGRPSHYFFVLIRYGPCNIVATPLATAVDAQNGDTISFSTSVTLKDIRSSFEIDVEVYSLSHTPGSNCSADRTTTKSRVTPRKLLNTITRSSNALTAAPPALNARRSSNFSLVGSHKITLSSLGHGKFPLDKMKLEGKIRRLLGDEFQEKVPFLSPLEGNIYLKLDSESHSNVQHQGFLTMFELISGYGVWHRRYFVLEGCNMSYWNHPNDKETKAAEGSISLSSSPSQCVRPVKRDSCARPFTFELVSNIQQQQQQDDNNREGSNKRWFSADTKQERLDWMDRLNQALLDYHTWNRAENQRPNAPSGGNLRESIL